MLHIGLVGIHAPVYYAAEYGVLERSANELKTLQDELGFSLVVYPQLVCSAEEATEAARFFAGQKPDLLLVQNSALSGGDCICVLAELGVPFGLWAVPEPKPEGDIQLHSLVSLNLYASILKQRFPHIWYKWFYGTPEEPGFRNRFTCTVKAFAAKNCLQNARIALIGGVAPGFYNLEPDENKLKKHFGLALDRLDFSEVARRVKAVSSADLVSVSKRVFPASVEVAVTAQEQRTAAAVYLALSQIAADGGYDGMAIACWPDFQDAFSIVPCASISALSELDGVCACCEGDVGATVTMLALRAMTGAMPAPLDLTAMNPIAETMLLWHCGIGAPSLCAGQRRVIPHPMMGRKNGERKGLSQDFLIREGPVTVARICHSGEGLFAFSGAVSHDLGKGFDGTRGWVNGLSMNGVSMRAADIVDTIVNAGVEHHLALVPGCCERALQEFAVLTGTHAIPPSYCGEHG